MAEKGSNPGGRINPTKGTPESSFAQDTNFINPDEHRINPLENGADPEEAKKVDRDAEKYKDEKWIDFDALIMA